MTAAAESQPWYRPPASGARTPGSRAPLACSFAAASTSCWLQRRRSRHTPARLARTPRITRREVDAEPSLRAPSGIAEVGVLTRRLAPGTTAAVRHTAVRVHGCQSDSRPFRTGRGASGGDASNSRDRDRAKRRRRPPAASIRTDVPNVTNCPKPSLFMTPALTEATSTRTATTQAGGAVLPRELRRPRRGPRPLVRCGTSPCKPVYEIRSSPVA